MTRRGGRHARVSGLRRLIQRAAGLSRARSVLALGALAGLALACLALAAFTGGSATAVTFGAAPVFPPSAVTTSSGMDSQVSLSWNPVGGGTDYEVQWRTNGSGAWTSVGWTGGATATTVTGLANNTTYEFQVRTNAAAGTSGWSSSVLGTPRQWKQVSVGEWHSCAVTVSGRAYCWGKNAAGQIGDGTYGIDRLTPVPVDTTTGLTSTNVASISTDGLSSDSATAHTCATTTGGQVYCWGSNASGELGDGTTQRQLTPTLVSGLGNVAQVSVGNAHSCALTASGSAYCWGSNAAGQLGSAGTHSTPFPVSTATGLTSTNVAQISAGGSHTCAVTTSGQLYCWGSNNEGQLGDGTTTPRTTPMAVDTTTGLTSTTVAGVAAGWEHTCAVTTAGQAYCWGDDEASQIGNGTSATAANPVKLPTAVSANAGLTTTNVSGVATSRWGTCSTTTTGQAYCWGTTAANGQLGNNGTSGAMVPVSVYTGSGLTTTNVRAVDGGDFSFCAVTTIANGGTVYCWGLSDYVGDGTTGANRLTPTPLATTPIPAAATNAPGGPAATSWQSGQVPLTWTAVPGAGDYQVQYRVNGSGGWTTTSSTTGTGLTVTGLTNGTTYEFQVRTHTAGGFSPWTASVTAQPNTYPGSITATSGLDGQVTVGWAARTGATNYQVQWRVNGTGSWTANGLTGSTSSTVTGLTNNTTYEFQVQASNSFGTSAWSASVTATPRQWAQVSTGYSHTCAVTTSGRAYCWGDNTYGQLGDGTTSRRLIPAPVDTSSGLTASTVASISAGRNYTCALTTGKRAYCWGANGRGTLGDADSTRATQYVPTAVSTTTGFATNNISQLSTGDYHACAVTTSKQAFCWGSDDAGEIGDNSTGTDKLIPTAVTAAAGLTTANVVAVSAAYAHTCAVTTTGKAYCWGDDSFGQLGDNQAVLSSAVPTAVDATVMTAATSISAGANQTCAVSTTKQAYCWGDNADGQLGNGTTGPRSTPTAVTTTGGLTSTNVATLSTGAFSTCAVTTTAYAFCWGGNDYGQLGDGTRTPQLIPEAVTVGGYLNVPIVASISVGYSDTCGITIAAVGGLLGCTGGNNSGQIGDGTSGTDRLSPATLDTTPIPAVPAAPSGLSATSWQNGQIPLSWGTVAGATDYRVQYRIGAGSWTQTPWQTAANVTVGTLVNGTTYEFQVQAHDIGGNGAWSASVFAQPNTSPAGLIATSGLNGQVSLTWSALTGASDYQVQWRINGSGSWTAAGWTGGTTSATVTGLTNNTTYEFQVQASNTYGTGSWSASVTATPGP